MSDDETTRRMEIEAEARGARDAEAWVARLMAREDLTVRQKDFVLELVDMVAIRVATAWLEASLEAVGMEFDDTGACRVAAAGMLQEMFSGSCEAASQIARRRAARREEFAPAGGPLKPRG